MKIKKSTLKRIIQEELDRCLKMERFETRVPGESNVHGQETYTTHQPQTDEEVREVTDELVEMFYAGPRFALAHSDRVYDLLSALSAVGERDPREPWDPLPSLDNPDAVHSRPDMRPPPNPSGPALKRLKGALLSWTEGLLDTINGAMESDAGVTEDQKIATAGILYIIRFRYGYSFQEGENEDAVDKFYELSGKRRA